MKEASTKTDWSFVRPPMKAEIVEPKTEGDLLNNWISTQSLLEQWQSYAMDFLEPQLW